MSLETPVFGNLQGMKVVLAGMFIAGPLCTSFLAENGAEAVWIESAKAKDPARAYGAGMMVGQDRRNLYAMALDIPNPEGRKAFERLIKRADVFIESNKAGTFDKWGYSDQELWKINSKLVIAHISGFGQTGDPEFVKRAAYDVIGQAFSGFAGLNGKPGELPSFAKPSICDYNSGLMATIGVLMAYIRAQKTGVGESIDVSMYETLLRVQGFATVQGFTDGIEYKPFDGIDPQLAGDTFYECKDGKLVTIFCAGAPVQRLVQLIGIGDDPGFKGIPWVPKANKELAEKYVTALRKFTSQYLSEEVEEILNDNGIACSKLMSYKDMMEHPHYQARNSIIEFYASCVGKNIKGPAPTPKFINNPQEVWRGGAKHGEDNELILKDLGFNDEEIKAMYESGAIGRLE